MQERYIAIYINEHFGFSRSATRYLKQLLPTANNPGAFKWPGGDIQLVRYGYYSAPFSGVLQPLIARYRLHKPAG